MSLFELAIPMVLRHEGIGSSDAKDAGGPTHFGISLRFLKTLGELEQDGFLAGDVNEDGVIDEKDIRGLSRCDAIALYRTYWWDPHGYERIIVQALANKVFDLTVNMGACASHRCLQRAVRAASGTCLVEDGVLGPATLRSVNALPAESLLAAYRSEAASHYRLLHQPRFEAGWLNRAYAE
jgi:lysozyme family protein